jgi:hypothetical protein
MRWGVRNAATSVGKVINASVAKQVLQDEAIKTARSAHSQVSKNYSTAKAKYKVDKKVLGRREAKKILKPVRNTYYKNLELATRKTSGEKFVDDILGKFGGNGINTRFDNLAKLR